MDGSNCIVPTSYCDEKIICGIQINVSVIYTYPICEFIFDRLYSYLL